MLIITGKQAWQSGNWWALELQLWACVVLGSQMFNILDAQLFTYEMVIQILTPEVYCENIRVFYNDRH